MNSVQLLYWLCNIIIYVEKQQIRTICNRKATDFQRSLKSFYKKNVENTTRHVNLYINIAGTVGPATGVLIPQSVGKSINNK